MTPQERDMIEGLFQRLKAADTPQKDPEAVELINQRVRELPSAPYLLVQTALVQEHALNGAQARISQLESQLAARSAPQAPAGTSFLGGLLGQNRWNSQRPAEPAAAPPPPPRSSVPITAPSAGVAGGMSAGGMGGGGFLQSALTTAAGVAGGALLFEGLHGLLSHSSGPFGSNAGFGGPGFGGGGNTYETNVVNNYGDASQNSDGAVDTSSPAADPDDGLRDASYDPADDNVDSDPGTDFGSNDDMST